jgi:ATP-binding cassette subfamily F protein 3
MVTHPVGRFSGGEKARLTLALLVRQKPNLLLLDEPTNHLDIEMREALAEALQEFDGALVVVAHDRHLLRATTDALWLVADGAVLPFDGDLDDYRDWVLARSRSPGESTDAGSGGNRRAQKRAEAEGRQREYAKRKPYAGRLARLEREMANFNVEKKAIEDWLASPDAYADADADAARDALKERLVRQGDLNWQLARLEAEWLEISEAIEKLDAAGP